MSNKERTADLSFRDLSPSIEMACWTGLALSPLLRWINGRAATSDQWVIQVALVIIAAFGAIALRIYNWGVHKHD